jgi:hypothetical protein
LDRSESNDPPKEIDIATDVLGKRNFDPSESSLVRVQVYKLRKKLEAYYAGEGKDETTILEIPTGSYAVVLRTREADIPPPADPPLVPPPPPPRTTSRWLFLLLGTALGGVLIGMFTIDSAPASPPLWSDVIDNDRPNVLVIGDLFVYHDSLLAPNLTVRNVQLNSAGELDAYRDTAHNGTHLVQLNYAPVLRNSVLWSKQLTELFLPYGADYELRSMTRFNPREIGGNDLIVVGMYKTLGLFRTYFPTARLQLVGTDSLRLLRPDGQTELYTTAGDANEQHTDYGIIRRSPGPNGTTLTLAAGLWDTATSQMVKNLTNPNLLATLTQALRTEFGHIPERFELLYRVNGIDRMELDTELLYVGTFD